MLSMHGQVHQRFLQVNQRLMSPGLDSDAVAAKSSSRLLALS
jgi:hypothetical protein